MEEWIDKGWISATDASQIFAGYEEVLIQARVLTPTDYDVLLNAFENYWIDKTDRDVTGKNLSNDKSHARRIIHWLEDHCPDLNEMTPATVKAYLLHLKEHDYADNTVKNRLNIFRQLIDQAVILVMIDDNPARKVNLKQINVRLRGVAQERRVLKVEEIPNIFEALQRHPNLITGCLPTVVHLGLYAGLRNAEMCWLRWDAIDWNSRIITIKESLCEETGELWKPKDYELRRLDVKQNCIDYLAREQERHNKAGFETPFVMPGGSARHPEYRTRPLHQDAPQKAFAKMVKAEGLDPAITVYCFRHTYATMALRAGVDLRTLQKRMGHSDIKTTMEYLHYIEPEEHPMDKLPY